MKRTLKLVLVALTTFLIVTYQSVVTPACGPFFPQIIFINTVHPDLPADLFAEGNLGVLQSTYHSIYLYVAYRNLTGLPFSPSEQAALWDGDEALTGEGNAGKLTPVQALANQLHWAQNAEAPTDWEQVWASTTGQQEAPEPRSFRYAFGVQPWAGIYHEIALHEYGSMFYSQYLNCPQDAFREAVATLKQRSAKFGDSSPVVQAWIEAQQDVFGNCSAGSVIPDALPANAPALARADRAYQIAAAHFYAGDYDQAASAFRAIAQDKSSPWSEIAPYLVARALVRKATVVDSPKPDLATLAQAETQIDSVLANPRLARYHHAAAELRGFIEFRLHPNQRIVELASDLTRLPRDPNLRQDVIDYTRLFPHLQEEGMYRNPQPVRSGVYDKLADVRAQSDLIDWMLTFRLDTPEAFDHSYEKWKATHSAPWLVAALTKAAPGSPHVSELLAAAHQVQILPPSVYDSVTFQSLRLMLLRGKYNAVREQLAHLKTHGPGRPLVNAPMPRSALNLFAALRFELAQDINELLASAPRVPATVADGSMDGEMPVTYTYPPYDSLNFSEARFDDDALMVLNRFMPVTMLAKAVRSPRLPENLRQQIALAAWTRAALLGRVSVARSLAPAVETFEPELNASIRAYNAAATPSAQRFAAALTLLRFPGLSPFVDTLPRATPLGELDDYRSNWWDKGGPPCVYPQIRFPQPSQVYRPPNPLTLWPKVNPTLLAIYPGGEIKPPAFLTASERAAAAKEWQRLVGLGAAPNYLSREVIAWAKAHPADPSVPEALALTVRSTRFGCEDQETGQLSKTAFDLLHHNYPSSRWAQQTKYWYKM